VTTKYFAENISNLRRQAGLSQRALGEMLGVSPRHISRWEMGQALPPADVLLRIGTGFGVTVEELFSVPHGQHAPASGMPSLRELYKIGSGPSSSHTMGPERACRIFRDQHPDADAFTVRLFGSLAKTGKGHCTDLVIEKTFSPIPCTVLFDTVQTDLPHPNTMELYAFREGRELGRVRVFSIGGGAIQFENDAIPVPETVYTLSRFEDIAGYCAGHGLRLWEYVYREEGEGFEQYLHTIWDTMKQCIASGLTDTGVLPGGLDVHKKARHLLNLQHIDETSETKQNRLISAYAFAVGEQNACGCTIVTAPTCGAAGVVPAVLYYQQKRCGFTDAEICRALATGGLIGNLIKTNASISGAECGCQAEVGSACAMAAAALAELFELSVDKIEYAAEVAIEHHLGLTCDPICGLVQIPCIERNAVAAMRAVNAVNLSSFLSDTRKISLDKVIVAMRETGRDLGRKYRETSEGGLAKITLK